MQLHTSQIFNVSFKVKLPYSEGIKNKGSRLKLIYLHKIKTKEKCYQESQF